MRSLPRQKLLNSVVTSDPPIVETDKNAQRERLTAMKLELEQLLPGVTVQYPVGWRSGERDPIQLDIRVAYTQLNIYFDKEGVLRLVLGYSEPIPMASVDQVKKLVEHVLAAIALEKERELKEEKIRSLKSRSIESKVMLLAQELEFDYNLGRMLTKLKLTVRIDERYGIIVDIPYHSFQEVLAGLKTLIQTIFELHRQGIRFKVSGIQSIDRWISHKDGRWIS